MLPRSTTTGPASPRAPLDLSANYVPMQRSRAAYTPQPNPPTEKRMNSGNPSSSHVYPSPPHEDFHPPRQVIRLEYSPRENGQTQYYGFQNSGASYVEASYQPPPPVQASYQPPPSAQMTQNNARRALPVPGKAARASSAKAALATFPPPPSYPPPVPSPTSAISHFLPSPSTSPPQSILPIQPSSRSHSPTSTELPEYSSARSYASVQIGRPPLQIAINTASPTQPARPEYAQYLETTSYPSPHTSQATSSLLRIPESPAQYISTSAPTDNERKPWYTRGNRSSAPSSPRIALASPQAPESSSGSSNSSSGGLSTPTLPSPTFVFPGSRSVARPKASKVDSRSKSRKMKDSIGKSPISDFPHAIPPLPTAPSAVRLPNSNTTTVPSAGSTNPVNVLPGFPDTTHSETSSVFSNELDIARARKISGSSGNTSPVYVFPVGRSRAQPKLVPNGSKGQRSGKFSGSTSSGENEEKRTGFMGKLLKKKTKTPKSVEESNTISTGSSVESGPTKEATTPANENKPESYQVMQANMNEESRAQAKRTKSRIGNYPLDPYDSVLLDNDRHTGELLVRLNPTGSPSFHNYGNNPPTSVLDLGCGQGHWVVDAAIAWKGYGTKVTGYDMVDVSKGLLPWAAEQGVIANIRFVRGNFLKQRLPFSNNSFDLVRMSCLALCITSDSWIFVLQEVARVLVVGGRLELIDDLIFFPYGKASSSLDVPDPAFNAQVRSVAPRLDITIPSAAFSTFSIYDGETNNPGLGYEEPEDFYDLYGVEEEDADDTATLNGRGDVQALTESSNNNNPRALRRGTSSLNPRSWSRACATSGDLEALFGHMLLHKFGINKNPSEFVLGLMKEVFGHAREIKTMHLTLAPPEVGYSTVSTGGGQFDRSSRRESMGLSQAPGLVLWPSTFIPMEQSEIEIHASKHLRMLLSCKSFLMEHAIEATEDDEIDEESVLEALWEYEGFLRRRFDPPPLSSSSSDDQGSDTVSVRGSIAESVSSDGLDAMWEIESEFRQRFAWQGSERPETPRTPKLEDNTPTAATFPSSASVPTNPNPTNRLRDTDASNAAPMYSRDELTHVRTFRIYEAIKLDETIFGPSALGLSGISLTAPS